ncbi:HSF-type DNA-binding-domain-containing protein [Gongronella butleri]|nr:HSF-type DNA-binding-domain-containing protein [Gongronella butleri]
MSARQQGGSNDEVAQPKETMIFRVESKSVPTFVAKLFSMVNNHSIANLINWSACGQRFCVYDIPEFCKSVLPQYFRHSNWPSFVRQLNIYGFHKVQDSANYTDQIPHGSCEFQHLFFDRNGQNLHKIRRKLKRSSRASGNPEQEDVAEATPTPLCGVSMTNGTDNAVARPPPLVSQSSFAIPPIPDLLRATNDYMNDSPSSSSLPPLLEPARSPVTTDDFVALQRQITILTDRSSQLDMEVAQLKKCVVTQQHAVNHLIQLLTAFRNDGHLSFPGMKRPRFTRQGK